MGHGQRLRRLVEAVGDDVNLNLPVVRGLRLDTPLVDNVEFDAKHAQTLDLMSRLIARYFTRLTKSLTRLVSVAVVDEVMKTRNIIVAVVQNYIESCQMRCLSLMHKILDRAKADKALLVLDRFVQRFVLLLASRPCVLDANVEGDYRLNTNVNVTQACVVWVSVMEMCWMWSSCVAVVDTKLLLQQLYVHVATWNVPLYNVPATSYQRLWMWYSFYGDVLVGKYGDDTDDQIEQEVAWVLRWHTAHQLYIRHLDVTHNLEFYFNDPQNSQIVDVVNMLGMGWQSYFAFDASPENPAAPQE